MRLAVYGSFRTGGALHDWIEGFKIGAKSYSMDLRELGGVAMYIVGNVPGAKLSESDSIIAEVWELNMSAAREKSAFEILDQVEGVASGLYERNTIPTPKGPAIIYTYCGDIQGLTKIKDWKEWCRSTTKKERSRAARKGPIIVT
jgi:gamma-glutamylcyclotransferase (GGCT)/AIG2-like uncharacterized protein YtfP